MQLLCVTLYLIWENDEWQLNARGQAYDILNLRFQVSFVTYILPRGLAVIRWESVILPVKWKLLPGLVLQLNFKINNNLNPN
jgi:hypothetical protein